MKRLWENFVRRIMDIAKITKYHVHRWAGNLARWWCKSFNWMKNQFQMFLRNFKERYQELFVRRPNTQSGESSIIDGPPPETATIEDAKPLGPPPVTPASGRGVWIWRLVQAEDGHVQAIIERAKTAGLSWITIKGADGTSHWAQLTAEIVRKIQEAGIKVFGWVYAYGNNPRNEAEAARIVLSLGCDGLFIDAEKEFEGKPKAAEEYLSIIRLAYPEAFLAYSTFALISKHPDFPYREFGNYCNAAIPQCYWKMIGYTPDTMIRRVREEWSAWEASMKEAGDGTSIVPIIPLGHVFNAKPEEVAEFMKAGEGFSGIGLWNWSEMTPEFWQVYSE